MTGSISNADHGDAQLMPGPVLRESIAASARVVVADPPWSFSDRLPGASRGAERNYKVMSSAGIEAFLPDLIASGGARVAQDAVLFCWRVASQVEEAYRVVRAWAFLPKSEIVWRKMTKHGKPHFGMGRIVRASHEVRIVAIRGKPGWKCLGDEVSSR
jgi:N6-adenosine-specific RNA methylase IME4